MAMQRSINTGGPPRISGPSPSPAAAASTPSFPAVSWATIGHRVADGEPPDETIAFWFIRGNQAYVECTLEPLGGQVVARVNMADGYEVFNLGDRVVLMHANGDPSSSVIVGKMHDDADPLPESVAGGDIPVTGAEFDPDTKARFARRVQFVRTNPDTVLVLESRGTGDIVVHSAAGVSIRAAGGSVVISGDHIILGDTYGTAPVPGQVVGEDVTPAVPFFSAVGDVGANPTQPLYEGLLDAVVRAQDRYQTNATLSPEFFAYLTALDVFLVAVAAAPAIAPGLAAALTAFQAVPKPETLTSAAMSASQLVEARS